jgi:hypothetical protein
MCENQLVFCDFHENYEVKFRSFLGQNKHLEERNRMVQDSPRDVA